MNRNGTKKYKKVISGIMVVLGPNPGKIRGLRTISDSDNENNSVAKILSIQAIFMVFRFFNFLIVTTQFFKFRQSSNNGHIIIT